MHKTGVRTLIPAIKVNRFIKGALMQIWKSPYVFVFMQKQYTENFLFLIQRITFICPYQVKE